MAEISITITPEMATQHMQFMLDVCFTLQDGGFHIKSLDDALKCVQELCDVTNEFEVSYATYSEEGSH